MAAAQTNISTDQSALLALKAHITSDPHNLIFTNWSTTTSVCNWFGVTCGARHLRATALNLSYFDLEGTIPPQLGNLSFLVYINLKNNSFHGSLPKELARLQRLKFISFTFNKFIGSIPSWFEFLFNLQILSLYGNTFSGFTPPAIFNLSALQVIDLRYEIGCLHLVELGLDSNNLNGLIPTTICNMSTVMAIGVGFNQLLGSLPTNIGLGLPNLQKFIVGVNNLGGVIPKSISNASQLTHLDLGKNILSGFIPSTLCALANLEWLYLFENHLTLDTSTPEVNVLSCLANLKRLTILHLSSNPLNAYLPISSPFRISLHHFRMYVYLYNCNLKGNIPDDIGNLSSFIKLSMFNNKLSGSIPTSLGNLRNIQGLILGGNELQGHIPDELCQLRTLGYLDLYGNQLYGSIPSCLGQVLTALRYLSLDSNLLNSTIPSTLWALTYILFLNLSANNLTGSLSEDVGKLKAVIVIDLSDNYLYGRILSSIGNLQTLQNLCLENNNLEGRIPSSLGKSLSLVLLDLSKNNLSGVITKSLESLKYLKILDLSFNKLQGEIPTSGPFQNFSAQSFVSSGELCGAPRFHVPACKNITLEAHSTGRSILKYIIPGILSAMFIVSSIWIVILRRRKNVEAAKETALLPQLLWRRVSHLELVRATNAFDERNLLGTGGFGLVYKGTFSDGVDVAIKVFNLQLEGAFKSFDIECEMLSNIRHRNLIKIISCCSQLDFKAVVLNYMPNESLEKWLHSQNLCLNIMQRLSIMIDVASALEYLHYGYGTPIVHCDLKPSNILLDEDMTAHVTDFGIAKLLCGRDSMTQTITQATIGYMAPVTRRGDVYNFGIVLMETFTGKKPTDEMFVAEMSLKQWVANLALLDVVDAKLQVTEADDHDFVNKCECLSSVMRLALACSAESPEERVNMQDALATLNKIKIKFLEDATSGVVLNRSLV
ncbi:hypothetical protein ACLB2K_023972 [Fragaria x ananassa]